MSNNPYAPPKSTVDTPARRAVERRPVQVVWAVCLICVANTLDVLLTILDGPPVPAAFLFLIYAIEVALAFWIAQGRNWARLAFLVLVALSFVSIPSAFRIFAATPTWQQALNSSGVAMFLGAVYLLFTHPGSLWFRRIE
jgi:hypothetical protein